MARETPVFISYARADEPYATELMARLRNEPDIAPWQDRISMKPGDFEEQIRQSIDNADYLVLVMTPGALRSPWVQKEFRYARENGHCVVPIKPKFASQAIEDEFDALRKTLPVWMQNIQTYDFDGYWKRFVAVLQAPCQATRSPFLAADLPVNFVARLQEFHRLADAVLDAGHKNPSGATVALYGTGGFGKTTLALSVCHDPDVFTACDGGVLWVTLGEQPAIVPELERIYAALTGERPGFKNQDDAMFEVAKKLEGKRCLIVIDDVWNLQDLRPFLQGGASCSRLITTRLFSIARAAASEANRVNVAEPQADEAARILTAGVTVPPESTGSVRLLTERLKRVPLLLELANRTLLEQIALGQTAAGALDWALRKYADLGVVAFDEKNARARTDAIARTVEVSLDSLKDERQRCLELGVIPEDTDVPFSVLGTLWSLKETQVQTLAQRLHDAALLKLNLPGRSIRLHDFIREYFAQTIQAPASVHARLADAWKDPRRIPSGYAVRHVAYHVAGALADPAQVEVRAEQLVTLLSDSRFRGYQQRHGDATALDRNLVLAISRAVEGTSPQIPSLVASLVLLRKLYATGARNPASIFQAAAEGRLSEAVALLELFDADRHWDTLGRLLIAWLAPSQNADEARALVDEVAPLCDAPHLQQMLAWVRQPPGAVPAGLSAISARPTLSYVSAMLQRAGGSEKVEGLEPLNFENVASGNDAGGFIAERDGPDLVAFAFLDPAANTQYLVRYIDVHAANRYVHYRNRSLLALIPPILQFPDGVWVRTLIQRIVTAALTVASVDFEEYLPTAIQGLRARGGDQTAAATLDTARQQLIAEARALNPAQGRTDAWSHIHRRASMIAEVTALAVSNPAHAAELLDLARGLPKGFAGFRVFSALSLAEGTRVSTRVDRTGITAALASATAASHRIQDHQFCLQATAMVNAIRTRWLDMTGVDLDALVGRFLENPLADEFCAVHRVLEEFGFRTMENEYQALPIPDVVRNAVTLRAIAGIFDQAPDDLARVNGWIWTGAAGPLDEVLKQGDEVNIPDAAFIPILAARFVAELLVADGLSVDTRIRLIQRLVPSALANTTALDAVLGRLMLATLDRPVPLPPLLSALPMPQRVAPAIGAEGYPRLSPL
jgi:hypothetical protein